MTNSYWARLLEQRASRRAVVVGGSSLAGAAALLAACGGGSDSGDSGASGSAKLFTDDKAEGPVKTGGQFKKYVATDPANLDLQRQTAAAPKEYFGAHTLNRLVNYGIGPGVKPYQAKAELAESWEISNGGMTYTFKMRKDVKFQNIAPVSGRLFDSEDVTATWKRFSVGVGEGALSGNKIGSALFGGFDTVDSVSAPDKDTVVFKLKKPNAAFLSVLASGDNGFYIFPKEADITYDPTKHVIGTGPWILSNYVPSVRLEYKKNPEYFEKGQPYLDSMVVYFIPEAAQRLAQFKSGSFFYYTAAGFEEFQPLVSGNSALRIIQDDYTSANGINFCRLDPESPFIKDERVRKALSLAIDRTTIIEEFNDIAKYKSIGVDRDYRHGTFVPSYLSDYWIDPRGKEMGESAQWFQYDVQKAKQLVAAAGYPDGFDFEQRYASRNTGASLNVHPILQDSWKQAGMRSKITPEDYDSVFNARSWRGEANGGIAIHGPQSFPDPAQQIDFLFGPTGTRNAMKINDPVLNAMQDRSLAETDLVKRKAIVVGELKYLGNKMYHVPFNWTGAPPMVLHQPQVRNNLAYRNLEQENQLYWWLAS